ncbi:MAG: DUF5640 domain-containing protein [Ruminococcus sp.]|nr:DUF5640 domain-containing protein [Ruminococcus sp.]
MKKSLCIILAILVLTVSLCACGTGNSIVGSWSGTAEGVPVTFVFEKDGNGTTTVMGGLLSENFTYTIADGKLTMTVDGEEAEACDYAIDGDTLTITEDGEVLILTRDK